MSVFKAVAWLTEETRFYPDASCSRANGTKPAHHRLIASDALNWMRGFVMVLITVDHASARVIAIVRRSLWQADYRLSLAPWLAIMMLGWAFGRHLLREEPIARPARWLWTGGLLSLVIFAIVRGINGYGNLLLVRDDQGHPSRRMASVYLEEDSKKAGSWVGKTT